MEREIALRVTQITDEKLTNDNTSNLHVVDSGNPVLVASLALPARLERIIKQGADVADGEEHVTIEKVEISQCASISGGVAESSTYPSRPRPAPGRTKFFR